jgi:hypothetical protein
MTAIEPSCQSHGAPDSFSHALEANQLPPFAPLKVKTACA